MKLANCRFLSRTIISRTSLSFLLAMVTLGSTNSAIGALTTMYAGDTLSVGFKFNSPFWSTPNLLGVGFNTDYTGVHTAKLYDGNTLLGTNTFSSGGSISNYFMTADSGWSFGTVVDFNSIISRSINSRIDFSISSGSVQYDPSASTVANIGSPYVGAFNCPSPFAGNCPPAGSYATITSITLTSAPTPPPTCVAPQVLQGNVCVTPTPLPTPVTGLITRENGTSQEYELSFDGNKFIVNVPVYVQSDVPIDSSVNDLLTGWERAISNIWSSSNIKDTATNTVYDLSVKANFVYTPDLDAGVLHLSGLTGASNPACRVEAGINFTDVDADCAYLIPRLDEHGVIQMFTGAQRFCYYSGTSLVRTCTEIDSIIGAQSVNFPGFVFPLMPCKDIGGFDMDIKCLDVGAAQPYTIAHEFGHFLGLPDEYLADDYQCIKDALGNIHGCGINHTDPVGIMSKPSLPVPERNYKTIFASLNRLTGREWEVGFSPNWIEEYPYNPAIADMEFELPLITRSVPEPDSLVLIVLALAGLAPTCRQRRPCGLV